MRANIDSSACYWKSSKPQQKQMFHAHTCTSFLYKMSNIRMKPWGCTGTLITLLCLLYYSREVAHL